MRDYFGGFLFFGSLVDFNNLTDSTTKKVFTDERQLEKQRLVRGEQGREVLGNFF